MAATTFARDGAGYDDARRAAVANTRTPDRYPDEVVLAESADDVIAAVKRARSKGWKIGVRSGGHSWAGNHLRDGGMLIDLSRMTAANIDATNLTAAAEPGLKSSLLARDLKQRGAFFPTGHCTGPCLGGYLLQGGFGWNSRIAGPGCQNVTGIDVVTADGEFVHASEDENADLFFAARGSGPGFFGVVTRFELKLHKRPAFQRGREYVYPIELLDEIFRWAHAIGPDVPPQMELLVFIKRDLPGVDGPAVLVTGPTLAESEEEARDVVGILDTCPALDRAALVNPYGERDVIDLVVGSDLFYPAGWRYAVDNMWTHAPIDDLLPGLHSIADTLPASPSHVMWMNWGPVPQRPDMAFSMEDQYYIALYGVWDDAAADAEFADWATDHMRAMAPHATGIQLADENLGRRPARFLGDDHLKRVDQARAKWDPDRVFHDYMGRP